MPVTLAGFFPFRTSCNVGMSCQRTSFWESRGSGLEMVGLPLDGALRKGFKKKFFIFSDPLEALEAERLGGKGILRRFGACSIGGLWNCEVAKS